MTVADGPAEGSAGILTVSDGISSRVRCLCELRQTNNARSCSSLAAISPI